MANEIIIGGECSIYACRVCRTKVGYHHQAWCELKNIGKPKCEECRYYSPEKEACIHPMKKVGKKL
ncbi:MAG: hypothetical protein IJ736_11880 [Firmicutes bacterium]|nr:hypothetical protein [Bacillota bacterium]